MGEGVGDFASCSAARVKACVLQRKFGGVARGGEVQALELVRPAHAGNFGVRGGDVRGMKMNMSNSCAFVGLGLAMELLQFAPGLNPIQETWLALMGAVTAVMGVGNAARIAWRSTSAATMRRMRAARAVSQRAVAAARQAGSPSEGAQVAQWV